MRILLAGDWHGNIHAAIAAIESAQREKASRILQVGDFGFWHGITGEKFMWEVQKLARQAGIPVYVVPGNHENYDLLRIWERENAKDEDGFVRIASHLKFAPRGLVWNWEGKNFLGLGGAVSVDRDWREQGIDYWVEEEIQDSDVDTSIDNADGLDIDYLVTHDCSNKTPFGFQIIPDFKSLLNREKIDKVLKAVKPKMQFHGHMHRWYEWYLPHGDGSGDYTKVYGLDMELEHNSTGILDTDKSTFTPFMKKINRDKPL